MIIKKNINISFINIIMRLTASFVLSTIIACDDSAEGQKTKLSNSSEFKSGEGKQCGPKKLGDYSIYLSCNDGLICDTTSFSVPNGSSTSGVCVRSLSQSADFDSNVVGICGTIFNNSGSSQTMGCADNAPCLDDKNNAILVLGANGLSYGSCGASVQTCDEQAAQAQSSLNSDIICNSAESCANTACDSDSDCTVITLGTQCRGSCSVQAVNTKFVDGTYPISYNETLDSVNEEFCSEFSELGCSFITPKCLNSGTPVCLNDKCVLD